MRAGALLGVGTREKLWCRAVRIPDARRFRGFWEPLIADVGRTGLLSTTPVQPYDHTVRYFPSPNNQGIWYSATLEGANNAWVTCHIHTPDSALTERIFDTLQVNLPGVLRRLKRETCDRADQRLLRRRTRPLQRTLSSLGDRYTRARRPPLTPPGRHLMRASETKLLDFLRQSPQFVIPVYQRTYSWTERECRQLWNDILRTGDDDQIAAHFVGSIVYIEESMYHVTSQSPLLVIDGQQRLTTVMLCLEALARHLDDEEPLDGFSSQKLRSYYLLNTLEENERGYKLLLTQTDKASLMALVQQRPLPKRRLSGLLRTSSFSSSKSRHSVTNSLRYAGGLRS